LIFLVYCLGWLLDDSQWRGPVGAAFHLD